MRRDQAPTAQKQISINDIFVVNFVCEPGDSLNACGAYGTSVDTELGFGGHLPAMATRVTGALSKKGITQLSEPPGVSAKP